MEITAQCIQVSEFKVPTNHWSILVHIAQNMPFSVAPDMRVCMKTITDDPLCKCVMMMDVDNKLVMSCTPNEIAAENKDDPKRPVIDRTTNINITQISASGLDIQP